MGLGFEVGQEQKGLKAPMNMRRSYFPFLAKQGLHIFDHGDISNASSHGLKVHSAQEIHKLDWHPYKKSL